MDNLSIGLDLDGCLYDWAVAAYTELTVHHKLVIPFFEFWEYHQDNYSPFFWDNFVKNKTIYSRIPPSTKQLNMLNSLSNDFTLYYITARPIEIFNTTVEYLNRYDYPQRDNLFFTQDKDLLSVELGVDYFLEDNVKMANKLSKVTQVVFMKHPWNRLAWGKYIELDAIEELETVLRRK